MYEELPLIDLPEDLQRPVDVRAEDGKVRMYVSSPDQPILGADLRMSAQSAILLAMDLMRAAKDSQRQVDEP